MKITAEPSHRTAFSSKTPGANAALENKDSGILDIRGATAFHQPIAFEPTLTSEEAATSTRKLSSA